MALKEKLIDKAQKLILKGSFEKAIAEYKAAADVDPRDISIRLRIGDLYVKTNRKPEAIKEYTEVAKANAQRGFYLKAIAVYKQVLKLDEANLDVHNKLAELYTKQRLIADAISEYSYIINFFERRGKTNEVLELLKKMADIDPENMGVRLKLADMYQRLSFEKDAFYEYTFIFDKLLSQGKLDKAEKVYLGLYNSYPNEEKVLKGLSDLYKAKGDGSQFIRFAKPLFNLYDEQSRTDEAKELADAINSFRGDDREILRFLSRFNKAEEEKLVSFESPEEPTGAPLEQASSEAPSGEEAIISWPEEEIEIEIEVEGFAEDKPARSDEVLKETVELEAAVPVEEAPPGEVREEPLRLEESPAPAAEAEIEIEIEDLLKGEVPATERTPAQEGPAEKAEEIKAQEAVPEIEIELPEAESAEPVSAQAPPMEEPIDVQAEKSVEEVEIEIEELIAVAEAASIEAAEEERAIEAAAEPVAEGIAQVEEPVSVEEDVAATQERASVGEPAVLAASDRMETPAEPVVEPEEIRQEEPLQEVEVNDGAVEVAEAVQEAAVVAAAPPVEAELEPLAAEQVEEEAQEQESAVSPVSEPPEPVEEPFEEIRPQAVEPAVDEIFILKEDQPLSEALQPPVEESVAPVEPEVTSEDLSSAFRELMEKMGADELPAEAGEVKLEEEKEEAREDYVDLSAELGMEEALQNLAGSWGENESKDSFDEFKTGIGNQLSREDTETHYNLGIAYMEMELYSEASNEFKIALKDPRLEFDCYIRLGHCSMAVSNPGEAILYYLKGLRVEGKSAEERKGMMYELALAYEAAGDTDEATALFMTIYDMDPEFREVSVKVAGPSIERPFMPLDDGLIEVELL